MTSGRKSPCDKQEAELEDRWPERIFHDTRPASAHFFQLCMSLSAFPAHACVRFTVYLSCACLYAYHCPLSLRMHLRTSCGTCPIMPRCVSLSTLRMPLCISLSSFPAQASMRFTLCISLSTFPAHASAQFTVYFPCACIYALHSVLALRMPLRMSLSTFRLCSRAAGTYFAYYFCIKKSRLRSPSCGDGAPPRRRTLRATFVHKSCDFAA